MAESFEELYNESLNTKRFNKTVTGTVIQISRKGEIFVDFKYNVDGIIPRKEYSDDENANPANEFKPGDTITADVLKWNDGTGNVLLSYKSYQKRNAAQKETDWKKSAFNVGVKFGSIAASSNDSAKINITFLSL